MWRHHILSKLLQLEAILKIKMHKKAFGKQKDSLDTGEPNNWPINKN